MEKSIGIVGGDLRISKLAALFAKDNYRVYTYGLEDVEFPENLKDCIKKCNTLEEFGASTEIIVSSVPLSRDEKAIYTPYSKKTIYVDEFFEKIRGKTFIAGDIKDYVYGVARNNNIQVIDIFQKEELAILNSIPTAEGAIQIAMEESEITLHGSKCLVLGYGRIGKILSKMLYGIGANVFCEARKESDLAMIEALGYNKVELKHLNNSLEQYDFIFNTVPYLIIDEEQLNKVKRECIIIDLASKPGGVNFEKANEKGIKALLSLGLPGKVAPLTSAKYIQEIIYKITKEE